MTTTPSETKTEKIDETVLVSATGHACCRGMTWESPFVIFRRANGQEIKWHSDSVEQILSRYGFNRLDFIQDRYVSLKAIVRNGRIWRIQNIVDL